METAEHYINLFSQIPFILLVLSVFFITFIENIFPPAPSDTFAVVIAAIVGIQGGHLWLIILGATLGSTVGFYVMFFLGNKFEDKIIEANRLKFISRKALAKIDKLFQRFGFYLVVANRFMSGTRAIISFFAGTAKLPAFKTIVLAGISSLLWYGILCGVAGYFGKDWRIVYEYVVTYQKAIMIIMIIVAILAGIGFLVMKIIQKYKDRTIQK